MSKTLNFFYMYINYEDTCLIYAFIYRQELFEHVHFLLSNIIK